MPIKLPKGLPVRRTLAAEGIDVVDGAIGPWRPTPPLRIALLNIMPQKPTTEAQIARLLGSAGTPVDLTLFVPDSYTSKSMPADYMADFYEPWSRIRERKFDGLIVTGAPVETLAFEEVTYWRELTEILDWAQTRMLHSFFICWAAQAALYHFHGVPKHPLGEKMFGLFRHRTLRPERSLLKGFDAEFTVPVSRHTEVRASDLPRDDGLEILADSPESGLCLIEDRPRAAVYMFNHLEYDAETLKSEYLRDRRDGRAVGLPKNYFPDDDPERPPVNTWRSHAHLLFGNWLDGIARHSQAREPSTAAMRWLLARDKKPTAVGDGTSHLLIATNCSLDTLPGVLERLAGEGLSPNAVRVHRLDGSGELIELRLDHVRDHDLERLSRTLQLTMPDIGRVAYRDGAGAGGILVGVGERRRPGAEAVAGDRAFLPHRSTAA